MDLEERVPIEAVTDLIRVGEPLPFKVLDAYARLLLNEGHVIASDRQYGQLIERGAWVDRKLVAVHRGRTGVRAKALALERPFTLFDRWERLLWELDGVLRATAKGGATCAGEWAAMVDDLIAAVDREADVALYVAVRQDDRRFALYPLAHALHAAVLCLLGARSAGWTEARQRSTVGAALSMNTAMMELQAQMAEQDEPPRPKQLETIRAHPMRGVKALQDAGITDMVWLRAVAEHHEHVDGSGYPRGIQAPSEEARLLRMADVYMAKITPRALRPPLAPLVASAQLFQHNAGDPLAMMLIKAVGVHPPGSLVRLNSGEVAVIKRRAAGGAGPVASTVSDARGRPHPDSHERDTGDAAYGIAGACEDAALFPRVLGERVYGIVMG